MSFFPSASCLPLAAALLIAGCAAVGPDYAGAPAIAPDAVGAAAFARAPQNPENGPPIAQWWRLLGDAQLTGLINDALRHSPDLHAAQARLRQSRASLSQNEANRLPKVSSTVAAAHARLPGDEGSATLYAANFDASWEIDLFGGTRRAVEAAGAEADAAQADLADTQVSLAAEVANVYVDLRAAQRCLDLARGQVALERNSLALVGQRRERGVAADAEVEQQLARAASALNAVNQLEAKAAADLDQLAFLTGRAPGSLDAALSTAAPLPALPATVDVGDPAGLLRRRPDIRAAERRLASRQAQIGEKVAGYFPKLNLYGNLGFSASDPGHLVRSDNAAFIAVPYLQWNLFDFGRTAAAVRGAEAGRDEAIAKYEVAVLGALRDANTALARFGQQRDSLRQYRQQAASAERILVLARQRRAAGAASQIDVDDADRSWREARQNAETAESDLLKDFISLQKSLGLGWETQTGG